MPEAKTNTRQRDPARYLEGVEDIVANLDAALEEDDPALLSAALGDVARAKGMSEIARLTGLGRESLYKARGSGLALQHSSLLRSLAFNGERDGPLASRFLTWAHVPRCRRLVESRLLLVLALGGAAEKGYSLIKGGSGEPRPPLLRGARAWSCIPALDTARSV
jgi:probable addiction module antidote protein